MIVSKESLPNEFMKRMKILLKADYEKFYCSYQKEAVRGLRVNLLKGTKEEFLKKSPFTLTPVLWESNGFSYLTQEHPGKHPYHEAGVYYIQEPSAMAVAVLADSKPGEKVLDLCAAPGGKTTHLASQMKGKGLLVANEIHPIRAKILSQNIERMGIRNAVVTNEEPIFLKKYFPEFFDRIVVDAPCSGEGMFRKDEIARSEWSLQNILLCAARQREILEHAAEMLKPGGRLVYSTCTFAPEEDEETILIFLEKHPEFSIDLEVDEEKYRQMGFLQGCPEWIEEIRKAEGQIIADSRGKSENAEVIRKTFRLFPDRVEGEGHFIAVLRKKGDLQEESDFEKENMYQKGTEYQDKNSIAAEREKSRKEGKKREKMGNGKRMKQGGKSFLADWEAFQKEMRLSFNQGVYQFFGSELYLVPEQMVDMEGLRVLRAGLHLRTSLLYTSPIPRD